MRVASYWERLMMARVRYLKWNSKFISTDKCNNFCYDDCGDHGWCDYCTGSCDCYEGYELMMKKETTLPKQECGRHLEYGRATSNDLDCNCSVEKYSMCDILNIWCTKNWIEKCSPYWKSPPPSSDYTPEVLEKIWRSNLEVRIRGHVSIKLLKWANSLEVHIWFW